MKTTKRNRAEKPQSKRTVSRRCAVASGSLPNHEWTYNRYRATLSKAGKVFAIVTPDGSSALSKEDEATLLSALNPTETVITISSRNVGTYGWIGTAGDELEKLLRAKPENTPDHPRE